MKGECHDFKTIFYLVLDMQTILSDLYRGVSDSKFPGLGILVLTNRRTLGHLDESISLSMHTM